MIRWALFPVHSSVSLSKRSLGPSTGDGTGRPLGDKLGIKLNFVCFEAIIHRRTEKVNLMGKRLECRREGIQQRAVIPQLYARLHCRIIGADSVFCAPE